MSDVCRSVFVQFRVQDCLDVRGSGVQVSLCRGRDLGFEDFADALANRCLAGCKLAVYDWF